MKVRRQGVKGKVCIEIRKMTKKQRKRKKRIQVEKCASYSSNKCYLSQLSRTPARPPPRLTLVVPGVQHHPFPYGNAARIIFASPRTKERTILTNNPARVSSILLERGPISLLSHLSCYTNETTSPASINIDTIQVHPSRDVQAQRTHSTTRRCR